MLLLLSNIQPKVASPKGFGAEKSTTRGSVLRSLWKPGRIATGIQQCCIDATGDETWGISPLPVARLRLWTPGDGAAAKAKPVITLGKPAVVTGATPPDR